MIEITIYERKDQEGSDQKRNVMLFVHGGGFIGGDVKTKGNQCRYLAQQSGAVVISPEYRLAPETPYPGAEEDVLGTIDWLEEMQTDSILIRIRWRSWEKVREAI